ncbi:MAG TPA: Hsp70 family protein [Anaeromyxobacter sp.]|nr:Hsp70 family protein [Anaeromyxobacter sp.]
MQARYLVGLDLGTVNSALAAVDLLRAGDLIDAVEVWPIPQLVAPGQVSERRLLPSSLYLPGPELPEEQRRLPWGAPDAVVGELARAQGARVPGRLVVSAKSWLAHPRADRRAPILPWGAPDGVPRVSPVEASTRYLDHLRRAWNAAHPGAPLEEQELVLAVPASFDEVARELTLEAAGAAGLPRASLLEEPAAAFHDWASRNRADLAAALGGEAALVLVVDVGGGTTDLTLVRAEVRDGRPSFTRMAVGDHLLLGGDNMDLALARLAETRLPERLEPARFGLLVLACRAAKEGLLAEDAPPSVPVAVAGRGSKLVGGAVSAALGRDEVRALVLDGFFPAVAPGDRPRRGARTAGLAELGLPYEPDPAITRHVAAFLAANAERGAALARPDAILVNGGVFTPADVRRRLADAVSALFPGAPPVRLLAAPALDLAVARGAAASALARRGIGQRIGGGSARAFYVGIATPAGEQALCVVPRHLEEGSRVAVPRPFTLALGRPVRFPLFASVRPRLERPGDVVPATEDLTPLPPLEAVLRASDAPEPGRAAKAEVPVRLEAALTEIGTLELWCVAADRDARWKLEFGLRGAPGERAEPRGALGPAPRRLAEAIALVETFYGKKAPVERREVKGLFRALEKVLGPREAWPTAVVRALWAALHAGAARRRRSADHERVWAQLTGFTLRPGFGAPLDSWRAAETFAAFGEGLQYQADPHAWQAWWVLWRRIAGGLEAAAQERILDAVAPFVPRRDPRKPPPRVPGVKPEAFDELVRLAGSLERVPPARKLAVGEALLDRISAEGPSAHALWALGRLGARVPFHGSVHQVVPPAAAEEWIRRLLALDADRGALAFPLAQLARRSGDRARDVAEGLREEVATFLRGANAAPEAVHAVEEVAATSDEQEQRIFGESLPPGLTLGADPVNEPAPEPAPEPEPEPEPGGTQPEP